MAEVQTSSLSALEIERKEEVLAVDIEGTGALRRLNQLIAFGWVTEDGEQGQVALYLGRRRRETFYQLWERCGFDMDCYKGFWKKNLHSLQAFQVPPNNRSNDGYIFPVEKEDGTSEPLICTTGLPMYQRYCHLDELLTVTPSPSDKIIIEADSYATNKRNQKKWKKDHRFDWIRANCAPPIFYIRAYTERDLAFIIHEVLMNIQKTSKITYLSDTLHYDASWVDMLLEKYGHPPLMYDQSGDLSYKRMCWGRELGSYQMGICAADNSDDTKEQYAKTKRWIESQITNGWDAKNAHFPLDDALKIKGSWDVVEEANRRRYRIHKRVAACLRTPISDEEATAEEANLTPEDRAEKRDSLPNWAVVDAWVEENLDAICDMASSRKSESSRKRQRVRK